MKNYQIKIGGVYTAKITGKTTRVKLNKKRPASKGGGWDATNLRTNRSVHIKNAQQLQKEVAEPKERNGDKSAKPDTRSKKKLSKQERDARHTSSKTTPPTNTASQRAKGRISLATRTDRDALKNTISKLSVSKGHIAFGRNGDIYELYFREHNGSPTVWKAKAGTAIDADGYRSNPASILKTGVDTVRQLVKSTTGRTPSQIGISLGNWTTASNGKKAGKKTPHHPKDRKLSLIDAAAQVLAQAKEPMSCKQMVEQVLNKGLWTTQAPTPHATLSSAILREIRNGRRGSDKVARFKKVERGRFVAVKGA